MGLIDLTTDLKSLNNKQTGDRPLLVSKDINDPPNTGGLAMQVNHRIDDLVRHTKLLARKPGLKFLGNQALLAQTNIKQDIAKFAAELDKRSNEYNDMNLKTFAQKLIDATESFDIKAIKQLLSYFIQEFK